MKVGRLSERNITREQKEKLIFEFLIFKPQANDLNFAPLLEFSMTLAYRKFREYVIVTVLDDLAVDKTKLEPALRKFWPWNEKWDLMPFPKKGIFSENLSSFP